jgi:hypothetical protein
MTREPPRTRDTTDAALARASNRNGHHGDVFSVAGGHARPIGDVAPVARAVTARRPARRPALRASVRALGPREVRHQGYRRNRVRRRMAVNDVRRRREGARRHRTHHGALRLTRRFDSHILAGKRGIERKLAVARASVLDTIARLPVGVAVEPIAPTFLFRIGRRAALVERVAMLEVYVALVNRLKARPAGKKGGRGHEQ